MRVVSLNAWGGALWAELADFLARVDADVLCLQEVPRTAGAAGWTRFEDAERALPQRADLFADVAALLPDARGRYLAGDAGPVRLDDGSTRIQDLGLATFVGPRVVELGAAERFVHGHHVVHEVWPTGDRPRAAQAVRVADREGGPPITVVHLHGVRDPAGKHDTPVRRAQAQALATFVTDVRGPDDLVVVAGDLNLLPDSETFEVLGAVGLTDLVGVTDTRTSHYRKPVRHASYLLVSDPGRVRRFEVVGAPEVSDHAALLVEL